MIESQISGYVRITANTNALIKRAKIDVASSGDNSIVSAVAGKKIRVISLFYLASGTVTAMWYSAAAGTALTGGLQHTAATGVVLNQNEDGWFETVAGEALVLNLSAAISVDGFLSYIEV
jgi:hypothetical protein